MLFRLSFVALLAVLLGGAVVHGFMNSCVNFGGYITGQVGIGCEDSVFGVPCTEDNQMCGTCECLGLKTSYAPRAPEGSAAAFGGFAAAAAVVGIVAVI